MKERFSTLFGDGIKARALRGTGWTMVGFGGNNALRLASNLILTRLLMPEAFGLMALVQVFITGLALFSDTGLYTSILQNKRGDDPDFLNTAWTVKVVRGVFLWLMACAMALPAAALYDEPMLAQLLPVVGLGPLIMGLNTTNKATASRHLMLGRITMIGLTNQVATIVVTVILAWQFRSVWALVIGGLVGNALLVLQYHLRLPGIRNRFHWDRSAARDLFHFGKWIFFGTAATFVINQSDRLILGGYVTLADLGLYHIGYFLGALPVTVSRSLGSSILLPLYRMKPPSESLDNRQKIFRARRMLTLALISLSLLAAFAGVPLVDLLYHPRYALSGAVVTMVAVALVPAIVFEAYAYAFLAAGDSRQHLVLVGTTAVLQTGLMFTGIIHFGIFGAIVAPALASLAVYPLRVAALRRYKAWDWVHDAVFLCLGLAGGGIACWLHWDRIAQLIG